MGTTLVEAVDMSDFVGGVAWVLSRFAKRKE